MIIHKFSFFLFFLFPFFITTTLWAHPHTFLDYQIEVVSSKTEILGLNVTWKFDSLFSMETIYESDFDHNGQFSLEELDYLEWAAFDNLKGFNYFTYVYIDGKEKPASSYSHFRAEIINERLVYHFFLPFKIKLSEFNELRVVQYDKTYFCDLAFMKEKPYAAKEALKSEFHLSLEKMKTIIINYDNSVIMSKRKDAIYSGSFTPIALTIRHKEIAP